MTVGEPLMTDQNEPYSVVGEGPYLRRYVRVQVSMPVSYTRNGDAQPKAGFASDIGGGGMRLSTEEDLPLGSVLLIRFTIPNVERESVVRGRIVLSFFDAKKQRFFHGIAFTQIDPRDRDEIIGFVAAEVARLASAVEDAAD